MRYSLLLGAAAVLLWLSGCDDEVTTNNFATLSEARDGGLFEGDRLPDILPPSAYGIRVTTDGELNRVDGEFLFDPLDFPSFAAHFKTIYPPLEYSAGTRTWLFFCDAAIGHCYYSTQ